jgi:Lon protease-like protein
MLPLETVVFPFTAVPLRVFEARYQHLLDDALAGDRTFGTVLISRGSEVGGGDERFDVGCRLRIVSVGRLPESDHRQVIVAGTGRVKVEGWVDEKPYPVASVSDYPDRADEVDQDLVSEVADQVRRVLALASELGTDTSRISTELTGDPLIVSYQVAALTPVTPLDSYHLLTAGGPKERLELSLRLLAESAGLLQAQLEEPDR